MYRYFTPFIALLAAFVVFSGCASTQSASDRGNTNDVLGTWKYRTMAGSDVLDEGVIQITMVQGRLEGTLRDARVGTIPVDVSYRGERLELDLDEIRIYGRVQNDEFTAYYERPMWDVSTSQDVRHQTNNRLSGSLSARRVHSTGYEEPDIDLGCDALTVESKSACS
ncbi:hypothetical protein CRI94_02180 [Longibacter salinarum]|uniref:Lipocalin-like domain-containing protein n=1 Tax=Longibacter salinarum TaxID=1850348 RepID=A0A2A8D3B1_9BACT|nr:hypothetical protein [Longibacter salinarum]PEN15118.1 hypothetical protein CRI94_02180 [Longibacter salinarum]